MERIDDIVKSVEFIQKVKEYDEWENGLDDETIIQKKQRFYENEFLEIKNKYPELPDEYARQAALKCSITHGGFNSDIYSSFDRDICVIHTIEQVKECKEIYAKALLNFKSNFRSMGNMTTFPDVKTDERILILISEQLKKHFVDSSNPILTWKTASLAIDESIEIYKEEQRNISF